MVDEQYRVQCMLPFIDMCNHDPRVKSCTISLVACGSNGAGGRVELVAGEDMQAGQEVSGTGRHSTLTRVTRKLESNNN